MCIYSYIPVEEMNTSSGDGGQPFIEVHYQQQQKVYACLSCRHSKVSISIYSRVMASIPFEMASSSTHIL